MTDPTMTPALLVAEALIEVDDETPGYLGMDIGIDIDDAAAPHVAGRILATPSGTRLLAALEGWAAIEALRERVVAEHEPMPWFRLGWDPTDIPAAPWHVIAGGADDSSDEPAFGGWGDTLPEAIAAALSEPTR